MQKVLDAAEAAGLGADRSDQRAGARVDALLGRGVAAGAGKEIRGQFLVGRRERGLEKQRH